MHRALEWEWRPLDGRRRITDYREDLAARRGRNAALDVLGASALSGQGGFTTDAGHWFSESRNGLSETLVLADSTEPLPETAFVYPAGPGPADPGEAGDAGEEEDDPLEY